MLVLAAVVAFMIALMEVTLVMVVAIFAINVYLARPVLDSFLFSVALAVGLDAAIVMSAFLSRAP